jgi:hypothetical protein
VAKQIQPGYRLKVCRSYVCQSGRRRFHAAGPITGNRIYQIIRDQDDYCFQSLETEGQPAIALQVVFVYNRFDYQTNYQGQIADIRQQR